MPATYKRNALGRIGIVINTYKSQTPQNPDPADEHERLNAFLNVHLSSRDWIFWQLSYRDKQALFIHILTVDQAELSSVRAFDRLFNHYKRAGFELINGWDQARGESYFNR